ncbi:MAG: carboxypeptidase-like regulatory domain-containing protein [Gemmataceae bacterium]|nr:carboxypeptidase-like regulatory domain-containing protein [Gemmataceae bacterium]
MFRNMLPLLTTLVLVASLFAGGCGRAKLPSEIDVSGVVLKDDGQPFPGVHVTFWPTTDTAKFQTLPYGMTDLSGKFDLRMADPAKPGIPSGVYKVTLTALPGTSKDLIPEKYRNLDTTPWEVVVQGEPVMQVTHRINQ